MVYVFLCLYTLILHGIRFLYFNSFIWFSMFYFKLPSIFYLFLYILGHYSFYKVYNVLILLYGVLGIY